jgi:cell division protein FtsB
MMLRYSRRDFDASHGPARERTATDARETLVRIVLLALLVYAFACLCSARRELNAAGAMETALRARLETLEQENLAVSRKLTEGWSAEELEELARERLGLVRPGDRLFRFASDAPEGDAGSAPP